MRARAFLSTVALVACGCDGGGGLSGTFVAQPLVDGVDAVILPAYTFEVSSAPEDDLLSLRIPGDDGTLEVSVDFGNTLQGEISFAVDDNDYVDVQQYTVRALSAFAVDSDVGGAEFLGTFDVKVIADLVYMPNVPHHPPNWGFYQVITANETVDVEVIPGPFSSVEVSVGAGGSVWLSWDQLADSLHDDLAPDWQRRAALATELLDFVLIQVAVITDTFNHIDEDMVDINPAVITCDAFTGTPPANVLAQGESTVTWLGPADVPSDGDDFEWAFTDCWFNDTGSGFDTLFNGNISLQDYVWNLDYRLQLIGAGFRRVIYNDLEVAGTIEQPPAVFTISPDDIVTVNGGFDLTFEREPG